MGKKSGPSAPDPYQTADAQAQANREAIEASARVNQINQFSPWGSITYTGDIGSPDRTQYTNLSPQQQAIFGFQQGAQGMLADAGQRYATQILGMQPFDLQGMTPSVMGLDLSGLPQPVADDATRQRVEQAQFGRMMALMNPQFERQDERLNTRLANQGIPVGGEAYDDAYQPFLQQRDQAIQDAARQAILMGGQEQSRQFDLGMIGRQQGVNEAQMLAQMQNMQRDRDLYERQLLRQMPMNELAAIMQGSPAVQMPGMPNTAQYQQAAPDIAGMQMAKYGMDAENQAATLGGLYGLAGALGSAGIGAGWFG